MMLIFRSSFRFAVAVHCSRRSSSRITTALPRSLSVSPIPAATSLSPLVPPTADDTQDTHYHDPAAVPLHRRSPVPLHLSPLFAVTVSPAVPSSTQPLLSFPAVATQPPLSISSAPFISFSSIQRERGRSGGGGGGYGGGRCEGGYGGGGGGGYSPTTAGTGLFVCDDDSGLGVKIGGKVVNSWRSSGCSSVEDEEEQ
ncbi:hypothetical protein ACFE04_018935 [Oxalis oulophora]